MSVASNSTATASPNPICFISGILSRQKDLKIATMIAATNRISVQATRTGTGRLITARAQRSHRLPLSANRLELGEASSAQVIEYTYSLAPSAAWSQPITSYRMADSSQLQLLKMVSATDVLTEVAKFLKAADCAETRRGAPKAMSRRNNDTLLHGCSRRTFMVAVLN